LIEFRNRERYYKLGNKIISSDVNNNSKYKGSYSRYNPVHFSGNDIISRKLSVKQP